jgi:hypothetical protein
LFPNLSTTNPLKHHVTDLFTFKASASAWQLWGYGSQGSHLTILTIAYATTMVNLSQPFEQCSAFRKFHEMQVVSTRDFNFLAFDNLPDIW